MPELLQLTILVHNPITQTRKNFILFSPDTARIADVCQHTWDKNHETLMPRILSAVGPVKIDDFGLLLRDVSVPCKSIWLEPEKLVSEYGITGESIMDFKPRKRVLKIRLQDDSEKKLMIDQSLPVQQLIPMICEKMGISNHDEFDLMRIPEESHGDQVDALPPAKKSGIETNFNPATLDKRRMLRLKKKLATEDDVVWVNQTLTLAEQGVDDNESLLLRRRYFYSDRNVDARDPVQLNLLYVQCRNAVLNGTHPVTLPEAIQFAGVQGQVEYHDYTDSKRSVDFRAFLPRNLNSGKKLDKKQLEEYQGRVQVEWQAQRGLSEIDAKDLYIKMARSLKTYGITFFLVKEKMKGRNKLVPRLFGVTRSAVLRLDEKTKETLSSRPIESIAQWGVTDNTLSLDFGDYGDDRQGIEKVYSIQTKESKQIAQLISGYAELIRKRQRRDSDINNRYSDDMHASETSGSGDSQPSQPPTYEELSDPKRRSIETGNSLEKRHQVHSGQVALPGVLRDTYVDRHDVHYIGVAQARVAQIIANFTAPFRLPPPVTAMSAANESKRADDQAFVMDKQQKVFTSSLGEVSGAVAMLINISRSPTPDKMSGQNETERVNHELLIVDLINNLDSLANSLREMAETSNPEQASNLMMCGQAFCQSISDLLDATDPGKRPEGSAESRQHLLVAVSKVSDTGRQLAESVRTTRNSPIPPETTEQDQVFTSYCRQIGLGTTDIVKKAKILAADIPDPGHKEIIHHATELALQSVEVITATKLLRMCAANEPESRGKTVDQLVLALEALQQALDTLQAVTRSHAEVTGKGQHIAFEIDEGALALSDVLEQFKADLRMSPVQPEKDKVLNALFLLNHQMRELDGLILNGEQTMNSGAGTNFVDPDVLYNKLQTDTEELRLCIGAINGNKSQSDSDNLDRLLELLQTLVQDTSLARTTGEWETEDERLAVLNYLKTIYETAYQFISHAGTSSNSEINVENTAVLKTTFVEAVDEFSGLLASMRENKSILNETLTDLSSSLARVDIDMEEDDRVRQNSSRNPPARTRSAMAQALARLDAISEALNDMTMQLKNVNPDVSYYPQVLRELAGNLCASYRTACDNWADFHASRSDLIDEASKVRIHKGLVELGHSCTDLMYAAVASASDPTASAFPESCKRVLDQISRIQLYLNTLNCGTQSCGRALSTIEEVAEELETAIIFASAGALTPETPRTPQITLDLPVFPKHSPSGPNFPALIEHLQTNLLHFHTITTQHDLSLIVEDTLRTTVEMVNIVRASATHVATENSDAQVAALRALKLAANAVAEAIRQLKTKFGVRRDSGGELVESEELNAAVESAVRRVEQLSLVVSTVEQSTKSCGQQLLLITTKGLLSDVKNMEQGDRATIVGDEVEESFANCIDQLALIVAKLDAALQSNNQAEYFEAVGYISELSVGPLVAGLSYGYSTNGTVPHSPRPEDDPSIANRRCLSSFTSYLETTVEILSTKSIKSAAQSPQLSAAHASFFTTITYFKTRLSKSLELNLEIHEEVPQSAVSPTMRQAQLTNGLTEAAAKIEEATRKLDKVQARRTIYVPADIPLVDFESPQDFHDPVFEFDESILDACKAIMTASAALIPVAGKAQEELVLNGRVNSQSGRYSEDSKWSQGFISAARAIGEACQTLCDAAHALMMGHATEEKLVSAARQVASFTAQLLLACRVRGDMFSPTMKRLLVSGNVVRHATDRLVQLFVRRRQDDLAESVRRSPTAAPNVVVNKKLVGGIAQEIKANEQVLIKERELVDAQKRLLSGRKAKYAEKNSASTEPPVISELALQEQVLIKERELEEARSHLLALRQLKYGMDAAGDEYSGYGANTTGTLGRRKTAN